MTKQGLRYYYTIIICINTQKYFGKYNIESPYSLCNFMSHFFAASPYSPDFICLKLLDFLMLFILEKINFMANQNIFLQFEFVLKRKCNSGIIQSIIV